MCSKQGYDEGRRLLLMKRAACLPALPGVLKSGNVALNHINDIGARGDFIDNLIWNVPAHSGASLFSDNNYCAAIPVRRF